MKWSGRVLCWDQPRINQGPPRNYRGLPRNYGGLPRINQGQPRNYRGWPLNPFPLSHQCRRQGDKRPSWRDQDRLTFERLTTIEGNPLPLDPPPPTKVTIEGKMEIL